MNEWEWHLLEDKPPLETALAGGVPVRVGDSVRLRPAHRGDAFDLLLAGRVAMVESIEQDYEGRILFAVVVDDDPGKDIGMMRQPGHRFFFAADELEPIQSSA
jgi:hypothetical protein